MMRPLTKPAAATAMGHNRAAEQREKQLSDLIDLCGATAQRVVELTDQVADLQERLAQLEAR